MPRSQTSQASGAASAVPWAFEWPVRIRKPRSELEQLLLEYLRDAPYCKEANGIFVQRIERKQNGANWKVRHFDAGLALQHHCAQAMRRIVPLVQRHFDLAPDA